MHDKYLTKSFRVFLTVSLPGKETLTGIYRKIFERVLNIRLKSLKDFYKLKGLVVMIWWPILALFASLLWAIVNIADKKLLTDEFPEYTNLFLLESAAVFLCAITAMFIGGIDTTITHVIFLSLSIGLFEGVFSLLYYRALQVTDVSVVTILLQTIPIFSIIIGVILFNEKLTPKSYIGLSLIIIASIVASFEGKYEKVTGLPKALVLMIIASLAVSIGYAFEVYALKSISANSVFVYSRIGQAVFAVALLIVPKVRKNLSGIVPNISFPILGIIFGLEVLNLIGVYLQTLAYRDGPLSIVAVLSSIQPVIVLVTVLTANKIKPNIIPDDNTAKYAVARAMAVLITIAGIALLEAPG